MAKGGSGDQTIVADVLTRLGSAIRHEHIVTSTYRHIDRGDPLRKIVLTVTLALLASFALGGSPASASSPIPFTSTGSGTATIATSGSGYSFDGTGSGTFTSAPYSGTNTYTFAATSSATPPSCSSGSTPAGGSLVITSALGTTTWSLSGTVCAPPGGSPTYQATSTATLTGATGSLTGYTGSATVATSINGVIGNATFSSTTTGSVTPP
jgi:hypothetical protein